MRLAHKSSGNLVEAQDLEALFDPFRKEVSRHFHSGKELQGPAVFARGDLVFTFNEYLPRCGQYPACKTILRVAGGWAGVGCGHDRRSWPDNKSEFFRAREQAA